MICTCTLSSDTFGYIDATTDARLGVTPAPEMAGFSSRGLNAITPRILKGAYFSEGLVHIFPPRGMYKFMVYHLTSLYI